jgi:hypothetical protein
MHLTSQNYHQRSVGITAQGILPLEYEVEKKTTAMTAMGGLPIYIDLAKMIGLGRSIQKHLKIQATRFCLAGIVVFVFFA